MYNHSFFPLKNKVALVTGGYKGIGRVFSETYAQFHASVVIAARNVEKCRIAAKELSDTYHTRVEGKFLNVSDSRSVEDIIKDTVNEFNQIDILVNAAGISGVQKPIVELKNKEFDEVFNIDFKGTFFTSREVAKIMIKQKSGKIINIASIAGKIAASRMGGYCISKAAVIQLTKIMALELMPYNIQVNALCPGYFLTDMNKEFFNTGKGKQFIKNKIPMGRIGSLDELSSTALYLATCPSFMTGSEIIIDGGHTIV